MTRLCGIVLAAGEGRRMGRAKALLEFEGASLVERHVSRLVEIGCTSITVVARPGSAEAVRRLLNAHPQVWVEAVTTNSQAESLAAAMRLYSGRGAQHEVFVITPVDMLPAEVRTHRALLACLAGATLAVTPRFGGRGGHPVIARRALLAPYETARPSALPPLRDLLQSASVSRRRVEVDDPLVLGDLDTPSDLRALRLSRAATSPTPS